MQVGSSQNLIYGDIEYYMTSIVAGIEIIFCVIKNRISCSVNDKDESIFQGHFNEATYYFECHCVLRTVEAVQATAPKVEVRDI